MVRTYRPDLDGLRTIAVYLVLLFHSGLAWADGGFIGVDLFFVLSGFLVTSVILGEIEETGRLRLGRFYSRRVRRLLPAALVAIVATCLAFLALWSVVRRLQVVGDAQSALLYYANWHFLSASGDYFATDIDKSPFLHFWSLSIEEQFYAGFPLLVLALSRLRRRVLPVVVALLLAGSLTAQVLWARVDVDRAYYGTDARLYQLLAGALLAIILARRAPRPGTPRGAHLASYAGLAGVLLLGSGVLDLTPSLRGILATAAAVVLLVGLTLGERGPVTRVLSLPVPVFLGRISYGTYLWHWPVVVALTTVPDAGPAITALCAFAISTGLAALSYQVLEMPIRRAPALDAVRWRSVVVGVTASAVVAATVVPAVLHSDRRPVVVTAAGSAAAAGLAGPAGERPVPHDVDWAEVEGDIGGDGYCTTADPDACTVVRGSGPHVLLVGDSQAQMLVPMFEDLAREHDLTLSLNVVPGCPWQEGLLNAHQASDTAEECTDARVGWYDDVLPELDPDVVVLVERPRDDPDDWGSVVARRDGRTQPLDRAVRDTSRDTLAKITRVASRAVVIRRLVMPETFDPNDCLASVRTIGRCAVAYPARPSPSDAYFATVAARSGAVATADLNEAFCPHAPVCLPVVDGRVVWRDDHHYAAAYAVSRGPHVWRLLRRDVER